MAAIGFFNTNLTIFEGGEVNFTIGVLQGYLDTMVTILFTAEASSAQGNQPTKINNTVQRIKILCPLLAGLDYTETSKLLNFTGDSMHVVSIQIIDDGNPEPSETFLGQLSSADGVIIPPNVLLQPNRATATIINENGTLIELYNNIIMCDSNNLLFCTDLPTDSAENRSTIDITVLIVGLVSTLVIFILL